MKELRKFIYLSMMLYFLGIVTGSLTSFLVEYKVNCTFVVEGEDETSSSRSVSNLIEEDVICHENLFSILHHALMSPLNSDYNSSSTMDVALSMVVPPPERV